MVAAALPHTGRTSFPVRDAARRHEGTSLGLRLEVKAQFVPLIGLKVPVVPVADGLNDVPAIVGVTPLSSLSEQGTWCSGAEVDDGDGFSFGHLGHDNALKIGAGRSFF